MHRLPFPPVDRGDGRTQRLAERRLGRRKVDGMWRRLVSILLSSCARHFSALRALAVRADAAQQRDMGALTVRDEAAELLDPRGRLSRDLSLPEWERAWGLTARVLHRSMNTPFVRR